MDPNHFSIHFPSARKRKNRLIECAPENTELYVHSDQWRMVDHILRWSDDPEKRARRIARFIFREELGDVEFNHAGMFMKQTMAYILSYRPVPTEDDLAIYLEYSSQDVEVKEDHQDPPSI